MAFLSLDDFKSKLNVFLKDVIQPDTDYWDQCRGDQVEFRGLCYTGSHPG